MNRKFNKAVLIAISLVITGILVFVAAMAALDFNFSELNTKKYETKTYYPNGDFDNISVRGETTEIVFAPSDDGKCKIVCREQEKVTCSVAIQDRTLAIDIEYNRKWYEFISFGFDFEERKMTVYLPKTTYDSLFVNTDTGSVKIPEDFSFKNIRCSGDTADFICHACVSDQMEIDTDTGDIETASLTAKAIKLTTDTGDIVLKNTVATDTFTIESDTGDVQLENSNAASVFVRTNTGDIVLKNTVATDTFTIESDTGDVQFENSDAASVFVKTDTGDITGTLLSEKIFITESQTGDIHVPKTTNGGTCELTTDTGDINLSIP